MIRLARPPLSPALKFHDFPKLTISNSDYIFYKEGPRLLVCNLTIGRNNIDYLVPSEDYSLKKIGSILLIPDTNMNNIGLLTGQYSC